MERMKLLARQADVLICAGRVPFKLAPVIPPHLAADAAAEVVHLHGRVRVERRHVRNYAVVQGIDTIIGGRLRARLSPRPEGLMYGS